MDRCGKTSLHDRRVFLALSLCVLVTPRATYCTLYGSAAFMASVRDTFGRLYLFLVLFFHIIIGVGDTTLARVS